MFAPFFSNVPVPETTPPSVSSFDRSNTSAALLITLPLTQPVVPAAPNCNVPCEIVVLV